MRCLLAKTVCGRTQFPMPRADPEEGGQGPGPSPLENHKFYRFKYQYAIGTRPLGKVGPTWTCWTALLHGILESYSVMIVFFEKAMITGLPLQKKLRTYKNTKKKQTLDRFSASRAWTTTPSKPDENFWIRAWIYVIMVLKKRYRS